MNQQISCFYASPFQSIGLSNCWKMTVGWLGRGVLTFNFPSPLQVGNVQVHVILLNACLMSKLHLVF